MHQRQRRSSGAPDLAATSSTTSAQANQTGTAVSNAHLAAQIGQQEEAGTSVLDAVEARGGRVTGSGRDLLLATLGEPPWQVNRIGSDRTMDRMKVLKAVSAPDGQEPAWFTEHAEDRSLGVQQVGQAYQHGGWAVLDSASGVYVCGYENTMTGEYHYFMVDYQAPETKSEVERIKDQLRTEDGGMTAAYGAFQFARFASGVVNFFNPADNLIQGVTGRNLDPFAEEFGDRLSGNEIALQFIQAAAEGIGAKSLHGMTGLQKLALGLACVADAGGDAILDTLMDMDILDKETAQWTRVAFALVGLMGVFANYRDAGKLEVTDYFATLATLASGGEQAIKACLGEDGYEEFWQGNVEVIGQYLQNSDKIVEALKLVGEQSKKLRK